MYYNRLRKKHLFIFLQIFAALFISILPLFAENVDSTSLEDSNFSKQTISHISNPSNISTNVSQSSETSNTSITYQSNGVIKDANITQNNENSIANDATKSNEAFINSKTENEENYSLENVKTQQSIKLDKENNSGTITKTQDNIDSTIDLNTPQTAVSSSNINFSKENVESKDSKENKEQNVKLISNNALATNNNSNNASSNNTNVNNAENSAAANLANAKFEQEEKELFDKGRAPIALVILIIGGLVTYFTLSAQRGKEMFIRRISGLSAIDDAIGRATEMGRGVLYIPGIWDMDDIQTVAGVTILGHVAKKTAEYDTPLYAPMSRSFVMSVAQEVVKQAYLEKGRADAYRPDRINYLTDDQFGYVAGVGGIMLREKPAACFYLGCFFAESLILAETGHSVGAIQIAGTAEPSQIPFFVAACDYTLIGEELFAASAYLSRNPKEVGSLKGSDMAKLIIIIAIIIGTLLVTVSQTQWGASSYWLKRATEKYMSFLSIE